MLPLVLGCAASCSPPDSVPARASGLVLREATEQMGPHFLHVSGAEGEHRLREVMGAGCALFDADGDGDLDAYLTQGVGPDEYFVNSGRGQFESAGPAAGLSNPGYGMGVAVGDLDDDGDLDLYVANVGQDRLYRNRGDGTFEDVTEAAGIAVGGWSTSVACFDPEGDGLPDVWVVRYVRGDATKRCTGAAGQPDYCNPKALPPERDVLLRNLGGWRFEDASAAAGLNSAPAAAGLGVVSFDVDRDGLQDIVVANDGYPNHVWLASAGGTFREAAAELGAAYDSNGAAEAGMGLVAADLTGDARLDLFLTHLAGETNTLYSAGAMGFDDDSARSGLGGPSVPYTGFGVVAFDADLDGDLDLAIANGRVLRAPPRADCRLGPPWDEYAEPDAFYEATDTGFEARPEVWSRAHVEVSRGLAAGDVDGDGDVDLLCAQVDGPARLWLNESRRRSPWFAVRCLDGGREALGAEVRFVAGDTVQLRLVARASSYLSSSAALATFAWLEALDHQVEVRWPDGSEERFPAAGANQVQVVRRGTGQGL